MNCRRVEHFLHDEFEGLTSEREARVIAAHLADCPTCRELQEELLLLRRELRVLAKRRPRVEARLDGRAIDRWLAERGAEHGRRQRWVPRARGPSGRVEQLRLSRRPRAEPRVYRQQTPPPTAWVPDGAREPALGSPLQ